MESPVASMNSVACVNESVPRVRVGDESDESTPLLSPASPSTPPVAVAKAEPQCMTGFALFRNLFAVYAIGAICETARGLVIPTLNQYVESMGGSDTFAGFTFSIFVVGRLIFSMVLGALSEHRPMREVFIIALIVGVAGNFIYGMAPAVSGSKWIAMLGRFIAGCSTGVISCSRSHIVAIAHPRHHTRYLAWSMAAQFVGFALSPGLGAPLSNINITLGPFKIDSLTSPGYLLAILNALMLVCVVPFMDNVKPKQDGKRKTRYGCMFTRDVLLLLFLTLVIRSVVAVIETIGTPLYIDVEGLANNDHSIEQASFFFLYLGLGGMVIYFTVEFAYRSMNSHGLLTFAFASILAGSLLLVSYGSLSFTRFLLGAILIWSLGSPMTQVLILAMYTEVLGPGPQGIMMGWFTVAGSVGSIFARSLSGVVSSDVLFYISAGMAFSCLAVSCTFYYRFVVRRKMEEKEPLLPVASTRSLN